jgi:hypothetical protein
VTRIDNLFPGESMRPPLRLLALLGLCGAAACAAGTSVPGAPTAASTSAPTVFDLAVGTWDWAKGDSTCQGDRHGISFSPDRREMLLTFDESLDTASKQRVVTYRILAAGSKIHPEVPFVIRAAMEGETRRTDAGELVVWDLILATPNRYHWHRTDWPNLAITGAIIRCGGNQPSGAVAAHGRGGAPIRVLGHPLPD